MHSRYFIKNNIFIINQHLLVSGKIVARICAIISLARNCEKSPKSLAQPLNLARQIKHFIKKNILTSSPLKIIKSVC